MARRAAASIVRSPVGWRWDAGAEGASQARMKKPSRDNAREGFGIRELRPDFLALEHDVGDREQHDHRRDQAGELRPHQHDALVERQWAAHRALELRAKQRAERLADDRAGYELRHQRLAFLDRDGVVRYRHVAALVGVTFKGPEVLAGVLADIP